MILLVFLLVFGGFAYLRTKAKEKEPLVTYEFGKVERGDVRSSVTATGVIQPWKIVDIKSNVAGRIEKLAVDLGDRVKAGQTIMLIDPTDTQVAVDQARADLDSAVARREQAEISVVQQSAQTRARVSASERGVQTARARLAQAEANMKVQPRLTSSAINQASASLVSSRKAVAQAQQGKAQLEQQLRELQEVTIPLNVETVRGNLDQAKAGLDSEEAENRRQQELLKKGYVSRSDVEASNARLASARAAVRAAEQRQRTLGQENQIAVNGMKSRIQEAQSRIEESEARVRQAQAALRLSTDNRYQDEVRKQEYRAAQAGLKQAEAELTSMRAEYNQIPIRQKEVVSANAQLVRGRATLKQASTNLGYTKIVAPRGGVVITKTVEEGTVVPSSRGSIGSTNSLLQIGDTSRLWIVTKVDETDIGQVSVGQKVTVNVDAYPTMDVEGKVIRIDPQAVVEQNVTMIPVTVEIDMPDQRFKPGMNAECEFVVNEATGVLTVPNEALRESDGKFSVQKLVAGKPKDAPVEVGIAGPDTTEIRSGLKEGETVITKTIEPEQAEAVNPFGGPFGRRGGNRGGRGGQGGAQGGGGRGGAQGGGQGGGARGGGGGR
ncbi:MAG: efflux RND transporter periplasmic adaptor subunit [Armatimonadetes bacterium]|nr:efflux RND transporter periplasmic adaptor subunit [Armatimonadota bacterium]